MGVEESELRADFTRKTAEQQLPTAGYSTPPGAVAPLWSVERASGSHLSFYLSPNSATVPMAYVDFIPTEQQVSRFQFPAAVGTTYRTDFVKPQGGPGQQAAPGIPGPIAPPANGSGVMTGLPPPHLAAADGGLRAVRPAPALSCCPRCFVPYNAAAFPLCPSCYPHHTSPSLHHQPHPGPIRGARLELSERAPGSLQPHLLRFQPPEKSPSSASASTERFMMTSMLEVVNGVLQDRESEDRLLPPPQLGHGLPSPLEQLHPPQPALFASEIDSLPPFGLAPASPALLLTSSTSAAMSPAVPPYLTSLPSSNPKPRKCAVCSSDYVAFCIECQDFLCEACIAVHQQDPLSRDHRIVDSPTSSCSSSRRASPPNMATTRSPVELDGLDDAQLPSCGIHSDEKLSVFCNSCIAVVCKSCLVDQHSRHSYAPLKEAYSHIRPNIESALGKSQVEVDMLKLSLEASEKMSESVATKKDEAIADVKKVFQAHQEALAQQEKDVVAQINRIAELRVESLSRERDGIHETLSLLKGLSSAAEKALMDENRGEMLVSHVKLTDKLQNSRTFGFNRSPAEDDSFMLKSNTADARKALSSLCKLTTAPYPPLCSAVGEGLYHPRVNRLCTIVLCTKDRLGEPCLEGGERLFVQLRATSNGSSSGLLPLDIRDNQDGTYSINFRPIARGEHRLVVAIRGQHISGSPFSLLVDGGREYGRFGVVTQCWGSEGSGNGQFCRPWGICCDQQGNIIVGDRSNHRIQVFDSNGQFKCKFGSEGSRPGQFNRPAGVAVSREGHVVVADKDNHRIQVLKIDGTFLFMFGSKGGNDGQMIYPYDVTVNHMDGRIAITDTGNHRLLIFSHNGILLGKFGYKGYLCGHFDSPRGIAFNDDGHIIVSDFNVHHILVIHPDGTTARILGSQGSGNGQFMRPQGIAVDHMGNFVVSDTRNNRIVIMHPMGHFITKFGSSGTAPGQFDRPTSVCVLPDGRIAVVDFGNSRIQLF